METEEEGNVVVTKQQVLLARFVKSDYLFCLQNMWRTDKWICIVVDTNEEHGCVGWMRAAGWYVHPDKLPSGFEPIPENYVQGGVPVWAKQTLTVEEETSLPAPRNDGQMVMGQPKIDYELNEARNTERCAVLEEDFAEMTGL